MLVLVDSYSETNQNGSFSLSVTGGDHAGGQTFTGNGAQIYSAKFNMEKVGSPTGPMVAAIYATTGTYGTSSCVPIGSALVTSASINASSLSSASFGLFEFLFPWSFTLVNGTHYAVILDISGTTSDTSNRILLGQNSSGSHAGNRVIYDDVVSGTWSASSTIDICFYVYGQNPNGRAMELFI